MNLLLVDAANTCAFLWIGGLSQTGALIAGAAASGLLLALTWLDRRRTAQQSREGSDDGLVG
jgi:hypothetical protein